MQKIFVKIGFIFVILLNINSFLFCQLNDQTYKNLVDQSKSQVDTIRLNALLKLTWECRFTDPLKAFEYGFTGLSLAENLNKGEEMATFHNYIGVVATKIKSFDKAKIQVKKAYEIADSLKIQSQKAYALNNLGEIYNQMGKIDSAMIMQNQAIELFKSINNITGLSYSYNQLGLTMLSQDKYDEAINYHKLSLELREKLHDSVFITKALQILGIDFLEKGSYSEARKYFNKMDPKMLKIQSKFSVPYQLILIAKTFHGENNYTKAIEYYKKGFQLAYISNLYYEMSEATEFLSDIYRKMLDYKTALMYFTIHTKMQDSLNSINLVDEYKNLEMKAVFDQKFKYLEYKMQQDIDNQKLKLFWNRVIIYSILAFLIVLIILFIMLKKRSNTIAHKNMLLYKQKQDIEIHQLSTLEMNEELKLQNEEIQSINESLEEQKQRLEESEEKFRSLVELLPEAIFEMDNQGKVIYANDEFYKKLEYNITDVQNGLNCKEIVIFDADDTNLSFVEQINAQSKDNQLLKELEYSLSRKDKTSFPVLLSLSVVTNNPNIAYRCVFVDISQRVENESKIEEALKDIKKKNKDITDSIEYALHIQNAVLPSGDYIASLFEDFFIINKPHTIVSGDFYYFSKKEGRIVISISDCTGHGVPGGFMTMLGITQLNEIYNRDEHCPPDKALGIMRQQVIESLNQNITEYGSKDGMDMFLGIFDTETLKLEFASANQSLFLMRNGNLSLYKGDKMPVGIYRRMEPFTSTQIQLQKGDILYLFTDGVVDLFGGANDRRLYVKGLHEILLQVYTEKLAVQAKLIEKHLLDWQGENKQTDDMVMIGLRI